MNKMSPPHTRNAGKPAPPAAVSIPSKPTASRRGSSSSPAGKVPQVDAGARRAMVAQAAYFRAQKRGFAQGGELEDWLEAEREIAHVLDE